jgi:Na+-driven multidrug efflux pump
MNKFFGDKKFYGRVLAVAVPIMIQNGITNFVNMLDNIMVGQLGTDPISGVAIINQLMFVFNLCLFGALSGIGIFTAQYYGKGDHQGVRYTFRMQVITGAIVILIGLFAFLRFGDAMVLRFLTEDSGGGSVEGTLQYAHMYMMFLMMEVIPFTAVQVYANTLRNTGETVVPMRAGIVAVFVNLIGNYVLIYGKFGAPALGVRGAAIATVLSRFVEFLVELGVRCDEVGWWIFGGECKVNHIS